MSGECFGLKIVDFIPAFHALKLVKFNEIFLAFLWAFLGPLINDYSHLIKKTIYYTLIEHVLSRAHSNSLAWEGLSLRVSTL